MRSLAFKALGLALAAALFLSAAPSPAGADTGSDEKEFVDALNGVRASVGLPALAVEIHLVDIARAWSGRMAAENRLYHNPTLADQAPANWQRVGENVGYGASVDSIHRALVNSPGHYANIVNPHFNYLGIGVVRTESRVWVTQVFMQATSGEVATLASTPATPPHYSGDGYRILAATGAVYDFATPGHGSLDTGARIVGGAPTPSRNGFWAVAQDGTVHARGDAVHFGGLGGTALSAPIVGMAATPSGAGYWLVARDGGIFAFGDGGFFGSTGDIRLNQPIVGMAPSASGSGYRFVAADGGVFTFGDAGFAGSAGGMGLGQTVVALISG